MCCLRLPLPPSMNFFEVPVAVNIKELMPYSTIDCFVSSIVDHVTIISLALSTNKNKNKEKKKQNCIKKNDNDEQISIVKKNQ